MRERTRPGALVARVGRFGWKKQVSTLYATPGAHASRGCRSCGDVHFLAAVVLLFPLICDAIFIVSYGVRSTEYHPSYPLVCVFDNQCLYLATIPIYEYSKLPREDREQSTLSKVHPALSPRH